MAGTVFTSTIANALKETLEEIVTDESYEKRLVMPRWLQEKKMSDNYEDDLEVAGPGLAAEKTEGSEMELGTLKEGYITRYVARTFALKLIITEEAIEDNKYQQVIQAAKRLRRALFKTVDIDSSLMLVRAFNTSYVGGDQQPLASATHTLPHGGVFSNIMAAPLAPSRAAVIIATSQLRKLPGHDGVTEGYEPVKAVFPVDQWGDWSVILKSPYAPEQNEFNAINVVNRELGIEPVPNKYWSNTTTNWCLLTDCDHALNWRWRRKARSRTWVDNDQELMKHGVSARWSRGWSDPRCFYGVNA